MQEFLPTLKLHARLFEKTLLSILGTSVGIDPLCLASRGKCGCGPGGFCSSDEHTIQITASDKSIINYQSFSINEAEHVQFIQPTAKSSVLNRITGSDPSQILGHLSANGRVFLINPNGICFGPKAVINTGSFLASTLNILDEDFLNDNFRFFQESGSKKASIVNEGMISSSPEGFVALFAPMVENRGTIYARAGKVAIAAAEKVTLDFSGDGLIQFSVDGELKQALIENYGNIEAANGDVEISLSTAKDAIKMVVNTDGITPADSIEEVGGIIRLVNSSVKGKNIEISAPNIESSSSIVSRKICISKDKARLN